MAESDTNDELQPTMDGVEACWPNGTNLIVATRSHTISLKAQSKCVCDIASAIISSAVHSLWSDKFYVYAEHEHTYYKAIAVQVCKEEKDFVIGQHVKVDAAYAHEIHKLVSFKIALTVFCAC